MTISQGISEVSGVDNCLVPLTLQLAYTRARNSLQAVTQELCSKHMLK